MALPERQKRTRTAALTALMAALACLPALAQTHKVEAPQKVVRAVGVYEWTGDMAKPAASRLIPVSLFIDGKFQDAAVYLSRPVPLALLTGNVYELEKTGVPIGTLNLAFARHLIATNTDVTNYDDGWFGYGKFFPPAAPKKSTLKQTASLAKINSIDGEDDDKPHFSPRSATPGSGTAATPLPGHGSDPASTPADDPDRPTLHRTSGGSAGSDTSVPDDPDRPTLRRRSSTSKSAAPPQDDVSAVGSLNDDPSRPTLHRGRPAGYLTDKEIPKLSGLPGEADLHQVVGVSDAANRPQHNFALASEDALERQELMEKLEEVARAQLAAYDVANGDAPKSAPPAAPSTAAKKAASRARKTAAKAAPAPAPAPEKLLDEQLKGFTLSYGASPTYVYHAHTDGLGKDLRYVTVIAELSASGEAQIALKNVTDAAHLDRNPRMKLVDAVDADASNRAILLFELRAQNTRQFALYRVLGGRASQIFVTGSTQ